MSLRKKTGFMVLVVAMLAAQGGVRAEHMGTAFTYQGKLENAGGPVTDACDFEFGLWDAATGGTVTGASPVSIGGVTVEDGLFTVTLDFGADAIKGDACWLNIRVCCPAGGCSLQQLLPRQELTPAPHALALPGLWTRETTSTDAPNLIGGYHENEVADGVVGATIGGGGAEGVDWDINRVTATASYATIGGGNWNRVTDVDCTIGGGKRNVAGSDDDDPINGSAATVAGGINNEATGFRATVGGGHSNIARGNLATIGGGGRAPSLGDGPGCEGGDNDGGPCGGCSSDPINLPCRNPADCPDPENEVCVPVDDLCTGGGVCHYGGIGNRVYEAFGTIGGGGSNYASGSFATIGGGDSNIASGHWSTVGGGDHNTAGYNDATVAGGWRNEAHGLDSTVGGGSFNVAECAGATIGGGAGATWGWRCNGGPDFRSPCGRCNDDSICNWDEHCSSGSCVPDDSLCTSPGECSSDRLGNLVVDYSGTVSGGSVNQAGGGDYEDSFDAPFATVAGGYVNTSGGAYSAIGGGHANSASEERSTVGGGYLNRAIARETTIGGGVTNTASGLRSTVGGGSNNTASGQNAAIGGGDSNTSSAQHSAVGGGAGNTASEFGAVVSGGFQNTASGRDAVVPGGFANTAAGWFSFAAGAQAQANHTGTFVWSDSTTDEPNFFASTGENQFLINATGGVGIGTNSPAFLLHVNGSAGKPGGGSWSSASDRRLKKDIHVIQGALTRLLALHGVTFEFKDPEAIHELPGLQMGMVAQDVEQVVPQWVDDGPDGYKRVTYRGFEALVVEALRELREEKDARIATLEKRLTELECMIAERNAAEQGGVR